jgi:hypothetical protein
MMLGLVYAVLIIVKIGIVSHFAPSDQVAHLIFSYIAQLAVNYSLVPPLGRAWSDANFVAPSVKSVSGYDLRGLLKV